MSEANPTQSNEEVSLARTDAEKIESCVLDLKAKGMSKDSAYGICTASVKGKKTSEWMEAEVKKFQEFGDKNGIENLCKLLSHQGFDDSTAVKFASQLKKSLTENEFVEACVKLQEAKNAKSHLGTTMDAGEKAHSHNYALIGVNFGDQIIGVTTGTKGTKDHVHLISVVIDSSIVKLSAWTRFGTDMPGEGKEDMHKHVFDVDLDEMRKNTGTVYTRSLSENVPEVPTETVASQTPSEKIQQPTQEQSKHTVNIMQFGETKIGFSNKREAEALIVKFCQMEEKPANCNVELDEIREKICEAILKHCPDTLIFDEMSVADFELNNEKIFQARMDPNAKVRNRPKPVLDAKNPKVKDNKDHFPIDTIGRARNALARVAQYDKSPSWYSGSLQELKKTIRDAVKKAYPSIDVTKASDESYSIRFKDNDSAFFIPCAVNDEETAREDAFIYSDKCKKYSIDVVKFNSPDDQDQKFESIGAFVFYDQDMKGTIQYGSENSIQLSDKDSEGNVVIEILRTGNFNHPEYGKLIIDDNKINEIVKNFNDGVMDREISADFNHEPTLPAALWFKKLSTTRRNIKGNMQTVLNGHAQFTPRGEKAVRDGDYRYFSSEYTDMFVDKETGKKYGTALKGGGLTNRPWIPGMKPIELSEKREKMAFIKN